MKYTIAAYSAYVTVKTPTETKNTTSGAVDLTWTTKATVWASVRMSSGGQNVLSGAEATDMQWEVEIPYYSASSLDSKDRIYIGARVLEIVALDDIEQAHTKWRAVCREVL